MSETVEQPFSNLTRIKRDGSDFQSSTETNFYRGSIPKAMELLATQCTIMN